MRTHLITSLSFLVLSLGAMNHSPLAVTLIASTLTFLLPLFLTSCLIPGGVAWLRMHVASRTVAPGPSGWPIVGSLPIMGPLAHRRLAILANSLGAKPLMSLSFGTTPVVVSSQTDTAREILYSPAFSDRPVKLSAKLLMFERAIGFAPSGDHWRQLRRIAATNMFCPRKIAASEGLRQRGAETMLARVRKEMEESGVVVLRKVLQRGSLENIVESMFGESVGVKEREELAEIVKEGYELIGGFNWEDYFPMIRGLLDFNGVKRRCDALASRVRVFIGRIIEERRRSGGDHVSDQDDFLGVLLGLPMEERLSDEDVIAVLWEMIFRGTDVVAILLEWIMARMVLHPAIQARAQQEIDAVTGGRPVQDSDIAKLQYLQAVTKETLRVHPPGPLLSWARLAVEDVHIGKFFVPAGTTAMVNMWAITHDGSIWKDPWAFKPERFLDDDVSTVGSDLRLAPFGAGRRVCPGRALGLATVHLWLARFLQEYTWTVGRPVRLIECLRLSMEMKQPLICRALPQSSAAAN